MTTIIWACDPGANGAFVRMISLTDWRVYPIKNNGYRYAYNVLLVDAEADYRCADFYIAAVQEDLAIRLGDLKKAKSITVMLKNAGRSLNCFELNGIAVEEIAPQTWQRAFGLVGYEYEERKKLAVKIARYYFGDATRADADAKLIALWKYWQLNNIEPPRQPKEIIEKLTITKTVDR